MQEDLFWQKHAKSNHSPHRTNLFGYLMRFQAPNSSHLTVSHSCRWILRLCTQINSLDTQVLSEVLKLQIQPHVLTVYANPLFTPSKWIFPAKPLLEVDFEFFGPAVSQGCRGMYSAPNKQNLPRRRSIPNCFLGRATGHAVS